MARDSQSMFIQEDLRTQWIDKLRIQEGNLVKQKAALRDRLRSFLSRGMGVEAGQIQMELRELDKELQKVNELTNLGIQGKLLPYGKED